MIKKTRIRIPKKSTYKVYTNEGTSVPMLSRTKVVKFLRYSAYKKVEVLYKSIWYEIVDPDINNVTIGLKDIQFSGIISF